MPRKYKVYENMKLAAVLLCLVAFDSPLVSVVEDAEPVISQEVVVMYQPDARREFRPVNRVASRALNLTKQVANRVRCAAHRAKNRVQMMEYRVKANRDARKQIRQTVRACRTR